VSAPTLEQWNALWTRVGATDDGRAVWAELERLYGEPHRAYHNLEHIGHCLVEFEAVRALAESPDAVELAIWFHDAIYDTHAKDNEEQSGTLARRFLGGAKVGAEFVELVESLILATKHSAPPTSADAGLLVDIDLAILGQPCGRYARFEDEIRNEYAWVAPADFAAGRSAVLRRFLERPQIYSSATFRVRYQPVKEGWFSRRQTKRDFEGGTSARWLAGVSGTRPIAVGH
jgi:predicted metal-dependent HD superfamily phosphohydrolase